MKRLDPASLRDSNTKAVLRLIWERALISRTRIADVAQLSRSTVSVIVAELLDTGLVVETGAGESRGGRPPILLRFADDARCILAVDLGASHVTVAVTNLRGFAKALVERRLPALENPQLGLDTIAELVAQALDMARCALSDIAGIGLSVPCPLDGEHMDRLSPVIAPAWEQVDVGAFLRDSYHLPVFVDNDANLGALAEKWFGAGREFDELAFIKMGTGVGGGVIIGGEVYRGSAGTAGEIGHMTIDLNGPVCRCGRRGCLEAMTGAPHLVEVVRGRLERGEPSSLQAANLTVAEIARASAAGDTLAVDVVATAADHLGVGISNLLNLVNPSLVVLSGDLTLAGPSFFDPLRSSIAARTLSKSSSEAIVTTAEFKDDAAVIGAATLVLQHGLDDPALLIDRRLLDGGVEDAAALR